jgi:site-specific recombinase XerD
MERKCSTRDERDIKYLDQKQVQQFFASIPRAAVRDRVLFALIYRFGLRASEACELRVTALDRERWELTVKGKKNGLLRTYTVPRDIQSVLRGWKPAGPTLISSRQGAITRGRVWQLFKRYAAAAGLLSNLGPHCLRHTAAVHALDAGCSTEEVRDLLRHRKLSTTDIYANLSTRRRGDYLARLEASGAVVKLG